MSGGLHGAVVVAVVAMGMVQVPTHDVVDMVAMGNGLVAAVGTVGVSGVMTAAGVGGGAVGGIVGVDGQAVFLDARGAHMVQVAVMKVIDMVAMPDRRVAASGTVLVIVV